jgi:chromosome segregation ATPase
VITPAQPAEGAEDTEIMAAPAQAAAGAAEVGGRSLEALQQQEEDIKAAILKVEGELGEVKDEVREVKKALERGVPYLGMGGDKLQDHLQALMKEKEQLRAKEAKLMDRQATAGEQSLAFDYAMHVTCNIHLTCT